MQTAIPLLEMVLSQLHRALTVRNHVNLTVNQLK
jgi:hypothetical protein